MSGPVATTQSMSPHDKAREGIRLIREAIAEALKGHPEEHRVTAIAALLQKPTETSSPLSPLERALVQLLVELDQALAQQPAEQTPRCEACGRIVYARRHARCEFCQAPLPLATRLSQEERAHADSLFRAEWKRHLAWLDAEAMRERESESRQSGNGGT
jgi:hypothetical protein